MTTGSVTRGSDDVDEASGLLPEAWTTTRIEELFDYWGGMTPSTEVGAYWGGAFPWISSKDVKDDRLSDNPESITARALHETRLRVCRPGSVLVVVRSGVLAHSLPVAISDRPVVINQDLKAFDSGNDELNRWLSLFLRTTAQAVLRSSRREGTTVQSVKVPELVRRGIPIPPLAEQRRIVEKVEALLARVGAARERLIRTSSILKHLKQAVLEAGCSGALTVEWRENSEQVINRESRRANKYKGSTDIDDTDLPLNWRAVLLGDVATIAVGGTPTRKEPSYWSGKVRWVSSGEVANCRIQTTRETLTDNGLANSNAKLYPRGTVLIAMIGEGKTRGQSAILDVEACTNQNVAGVICDQSLVDPEFVWRWALREYEMTRSVGRGGNQPALNGAKVRALGFPLPPLDEQHAIVQRMDSLLALIDTIEKRANAAFARADKLTQSILSKAFAGELVPTEAELARREGRDYEPASVLLERIGQKRAVAAKSGRSSPRKRSGK